jgi:hypothetical protein
MSRTSFKKGSRSGAVPGALASLVIGLSLAVGVPDNAMAAPCRTLVLHGTARGNDGAALRRYVLAVFLHNHDHPLRHVRTSTTGGYSVRLCKGTAVRTYARRHNHRVGFDLWAHAYRAKSAYHVRTIAVAIGASKVRVPSHFVRARVVQGSSGTASSDTSETTTEAAASPVTGTVDLGAYLVHPSVMVVEAVPHMRVDYDVSSTSARAIEAVVGVSDDAFSASGSMSIGGTAAFDSGRTLRTGPGQAHVAKVVRSDLSVDSRFTCPQPALTPWWGGVSVGSLPPCISESHGRWTGDVHVRATTYKPCGAGRARLMFFSNHSQRFVRVGRGTVFTARVKVGALMSSLAVSTEYQAGTSYTYFFDQTARKHRFCLGGNGKYVASSSRLYVSALGTGGGSTGCLATQADASPCDVTAAKQD